MLRLTHPGVRASQRINQNQFSAHSSDNFEIEKGPRKTKASEEHRALCDTLAHDATENCAETIAHQTTHHKHKQTPSKAEASRAAFLIWLNAVPLTLLNQLDARQKH